MPAASNSASNEKLQPIKNLAEFKQLSLNYVRRFNNERISLKTKGMTPVQRTIPLRVDTLNNKSVISRGCFE
ncbi:IS3 family transposase [Limosilactobacillus fermentum]|uniref:IS3 family transposase n=1 Tax=Limosilactobacillus fermentum TaxID=1613 RepID=UPI001CA7166F|nr:IS3 family transposase [Limosilactobacillus fermentum]QZY75861.1 integrase core domain-containing protein [Limosilactobacillus fermentum]